MLGLVFYEMLTGYNPFAEVGRHLRGTDDEKRDELNRLHLEARQLEKFELLERHEEIRRQPWRGEVIRAALRPDMSSRAYRNACELHAAWKREGAIQNEQPWAKVRRLVGEAKQCYAVSSIDRGDELLHEALEINRDRNRVPDTMVVGGCYLRAVERLLETKKNEEAGKLANEGYRRRKCRSTCLAMARYYRAETSDLAAILEREATTCSDQE